VVVLITNTTYLCRPCHRRRVHRLCHRRPCLPRAHQSVHHHHHHAHHAWALCRLHAQQQCFQFFSTLCNISWLLHMMGPHGFILCASQECCREAHCASAMHCCHEKRLADCALHEAMLPPGAACGRRWKSCCCCSAVVALLLLLISCCCAHLALALPPLLCL
jgi:hypothetical protein